jgi:hypothetical protein
MTKINMTREMDTTIAALRLWQRLRHAGLPEMEIAEDHGPAISNDEIDGLVARLQFDAGDDIEPEPIVIEVSGGVAWETRNPIGFPVEIIDHDNEEAEGE